ncbi:hemerythrin domain-containing protein [Alloiococcus sp. CFN-8]|uniref:hemerythrin domain-containing protein n=1 Tax=Alloiococcus sp. CFN-8 TaxID=3416081 RepID=UPI003CF8163B
MKAFEIMVEEHKNILEMLEVIRAYSLKILKGEKVNYEDFYKIIEFIRNYADKHHHGKEEELLFNKMVEKLGAPGEKLVKYGMLVEHDLGRLFVKDLEEAVGRVIEGNMEARLDVIANAIGYSNLLKRHIEKEDSVVYVFAEKNLPEATLEELEQQCNSYEEAKEGEAKKYLYILKELKSKI